MSEEGEVQDRKGDPNPARLLAKILDKVDLILTQHGMGFREDKSWEDFGAALAAMCYEYYDDITGGDSSYQPGQTESSDELTSESVSQSLGSDTGSEEAIESEDERPAVKKHKQH